MLLAHFSCPLGKPLWGSDRVVRMGEIDNRCKQSNHKQNLGEQSAGLAKLLSACDV